MVGAATVDPNVLWRKYDQKWFIYVLWRKYDLTLRAWGVHLKGGFAFS